MRAGRERPTGRRTQAPQYTCSHCGGGDVQVSMPTWVDPNNDWQPIPCAAVDLDADELDVWCATCDEHHPINDAENDRVIRASYRS